MPGKNQEDDLNNFVLGCLDGLSEEMTIVREDASASLEVQSYTTPSRMRALLAVADDVPESYKNSGALKIHESCAFSIRDKSGLIIAKVRMWVEYDIAPSTKAEGVYRASLGKVKLVLTERDSRPVPPGAPGSVCNWSNIPKSLSKHYVRVPDKPTHVWYSTCNLQIHNPKYMIRRVFYDVRNVEECVTRAYGVISGMPLPLIKLPFCNALVERRENGDYRVVVRSIVTLAGYGTSNVVQQGAARHGEGDSGPKVGVCMSFVASLAKSAYATMLRSVRLEINTLGNVLTFGDDVSVRDFLAGSIQTTDFEGRHIFNFGEEIEAHGRGIWQDVERRHHWASHSVPVHGSCGIFVQPSDQIRDILRSQQPQSANIVGSTGVDRGKLQTLLSSILSDSSGKAISVTVTDHFVAHEGVLIDSGGDARTLPVNQHTLEEHLVCEVGGVPDIHLHACVEYVVEDVDARGGVYDPGLRIRNVRVGTRVVSNAQEISRNISEEGGIARSAFAWFDVDQPCIATDRAVFRAAIGMIPLLPQTCDLLSLDRTYPSRSDAEVGDSIKKNMIPALATYAKRISERNAEAILRATGDPLRGGADTRRLEKMLQDGRVLVQSPGDLSIEEYGVAFISPSFDPTKCEDNVLRNAGVVRARLAATLQNMIGHPRLHAAVVEALVSMSDPEKTDLVRLCRELICSSILSKKCAVRISDAGLRIIPDLGPDGTGTLRLYQHVLLAPSAWWTKDPIGVHLVVRSDLVIQKSITGELELSITNVRFGLRATRGTVLKKACLLLECNMSLLGLRSTVDVPPSRDGVYCTRALQVLAAVQSCYGAAYSYPLVDPLSNIRDASESLALLVRTGVSVFPTLYGVENVLNNPLLCFVDSSQEVGDHVTSESVVDNWISSRCQKYDGDLSGLMADVFCNSTDIRNLVRFLSCSLGSDVEIAAVERGGHREPGDISAIFASGTDGVLVVRPCLVRSAGTTSLGIVCACNVSVHPTDDGVLVQVRGLKVFMCSGEKLTQFFSSTTGIVEGRGYYERYSEFLSALETCCDLSTNCLQAQVQSRKFLGCVRSRQGITQDLLPTPQDMQTQEGAAPVTVKRSKSGKPLPEPMDTKIVQEIRSYNLLATTFGGEHFPGDRHILWTMRTLVDVASSGKVSCAPPTGSAHQGGTLRTDVARVSDDVMWVMHSACFITPDLIVITTEMQYKVVRKRSSDGKQEAYTICDACFSFASGDSPSKKDVTIQIPKSVPISRSKWDVFKDMLKPPVAPESFLDRMKRWLATAWDSLKSFVSRAGEYMIRLFRACCPCVRPQHVSEEETTLLDSDHDSRECGRAAPLVSEAAQVIGASAENVHSSDADVEQGSEKAESVTGSRKSIAGMALEGTPECYHSALSLLDVTAPIIGASAEHVHSSNADVVQGSGQAESVTDMKKPSNVPPKKPPRLARSVQSSSGRSVEGIAQGGGSSSSAGLRSTAAGSCPNVSSGNAPSTSILGPIAAQAERASSEIRIKSSGDSGISQQR
ncbi:hypothetical protein O998_03805 [Anaplasma phagocytophilum str. Norway variant1]|uniref:Uncharacterized protein n=1 Tax=Anaplasma phagocytophilum str. Norway variant1 TaxID=1392506 RepID=A0A7H9E0D3_ANAPH|nr:hypothetical protein [Anaplasma phagocytophilum]QLL66889.1 hypothetical protein O998_03805 [Anaplasma phagocytophilum str. Norway variant1]